MTLLTASLLTLREGKRFVSRELLPGEQRTVLAALRAWEQLAPGPGVLRMRALLVEGKLRAMSTGTFSRSRERATFGYTDERGRVLLNPRLCFAGGNLHPRDVVITFSTLAHEYEHLGNGASEVEACLAECRVVEVALRQAEHPLHAELLKWQEMMPARGRVAKRP